MKVLHIMATGRIGGIEILMKNYARYSDITNKFVFIRDGGEIADEMKQEGVDVQVWKAPKKDFFKTVKQIVQLCDNERISDVISQHEGLFMRVVLICIKLIRPKIKTYAYIHSAFEELHYQGISWYEMIYIFLKRRIYKFALLSVDGIISISECVKKSVVEYMGISPDKIAVIYNGVPLSEFRNRKEKITDIVRLIYVGRLRQVKGVQNIIPAIKIVRKEYNITLDVVGDGPYRKELENLAEQHGVKDIIHFCGACMDVPDRLANADIFIHMPIWEEGFGITIVEAMAAGCICVCGAKGAIPEIIQDGVNGYLVQPVDEKNLADALLKIIPDYLHDGCKKTRKSAMDRARDFSIQKYSEALDNYLNRG